MSAQLLVQSPLVGHTRRIAPVPPELISGAGRLTQGAAVRRGV